MSRFIKVINIFLFMFLIFMVVGTAAVVYETKERNEYYDSRGDITIEGAELEYVGTDLNDAAAPSDAGYYKISIDVYNGDIYNTKCDNLYFDLEGGIWDYNMNEDYDSPFYYDNLPMLPAKQKATIEKYLTIYNSTREITISYNQNNSDTAQAITLEVPR